VPFHVVGWQLTWQTFVTKTFIIDFEVAADVAMHCDEYFYHKVQ
jgi:hypothetical protein